MNFIQKNPTDSRHEEYHDGEYEYWPLEGALKSKSVSIPAALVNGLELLAAVLATGVLIVVLAVLYVISSPLAIGETSAVINANVFNNTDGQRIVYTLSPAAEPDRILQDGALKGDKDTLFFAQLTPKTTYLLRYYDEARKEVGDFRFTTLSGSEPSQPTELPSAPTDIPEATQIPSEAETTEAPSEEVTEAPAEETTEPTIPETTEAPTEPGHPGYHPPDPGPPAAPGTEPTEPTTEPTEPTTEPTEPTTEPTEPTTEPTEPATEPTEPATEPTEPTTEPTEPTTEPTEPPTEPTEPTTEPTEPPTEPTEPEIIVVEPDMGPVSYIPPQESGDEIDAYFQFEEYHTFQNVPADGYSLRITQGDTEITDYTAERSEDGTLRVSFTGSPIPIGRATATTVTLTIGGNTYISTNTVFPPSLGTVEVTVTKNGDGTHTFTVTGDVVSDGIEQMVCEVLLYTALEDYEGVNILLSAESGSRYSGTYTTRIESENDPEQADIIVTAYWARLAPGTYYESAMNHCIYTP